MAFWICLLIGIVAGACLGGHRSISEYRRGDLPAARASLRSGRWCSAIAAILAAFVFLCWPFKREKVGVPEEVVATVIETVTVPKTVYDWYVWPRTVQTVQEVPRQVVRTIIHEREVRGFSAWLLIPMALVGWLASKTLAWAVHLALRVWG